MEKAFRLHTHIETDSISHTHSGCQRRRVKRTFLGRQMLFFSNYFKIDGIKMFFLFLLILPNTFVIVLLFSLCGTRTLRNPIIKRHTRTLPPTVSQTRTHTEFV